MMLERNLEKSVRRLLTAKEARLVLEQITEWKGPVDKEWKSRADANQAAIKRGDPLEYAKVFKGLKKLEAKADLRPQDRAHLNQTMDFLAEEIAFSLDKTQEQARNLISEASRA